MVGWLRTDSFFPPPKTIFATIPFIYMTLYIYCKVRIIGRETGHVSSPTEKFKTYYIVYILMLFWLP